MILDTPSVIVRARRGEKIEENITSITLVEYPPIRNYEGFRGRIYFLDSSAVPKKLAMTFVHTHNVYK